MLHTLWSLAALAVTVVGGILAFGFSRGFVRRRLRFVDAVHSPLTPWVAGGIGLLVAVPFTLLPLIGAATVAVVGVGAGLGAKSGLKALQRGDLV